MTHIDTEELKSWGICHTIFLYDEFNQRPDLEMKQGPQRLRHPPLTSGLGTIDPDYTYLIGVKDAWTSQGIAAQANYEYLKTTYENIPGVYELAYVNSSAFAFDARLLSSDAPQVESLICDCESLSEHPVIDDGIYQRLWQEAIDDAIASWFEQELVECLERMHGVEFDAYPIDFPRKVLNTAITVAEQEWVEQSDGSLYLDPQAIAPHIEMKKLKQTIPYTQAKDDFLHRIAEILAANIPSDWAIDEQWDETMVRVTISFDQRSLTLISNHVI